MTIAQTEAEICGIVPGETDARFLSQHLSAYAFARPLAKDRQVLEVGFGEGYGAAYLAEVAKDVLAVDLAPGNVPRAAAKYVRPNLRFQQVDATMLKLPERSFDLICSFQVIEHIPEPQLMSYLTNIIRVMRPDGVCCISTLNLAHNMKPGKPYEKLIYHEKEFTGPELFALLRQAFPVVELYGLHLSAKHRVMERLKKWGLHRFGPPAWNPVRRFYERVSTDDFVATRDTSARCLDLFAVCRLSAQ